MISPWPGGRHRGFHRPIRPLKPLQGASGDGTGLTVRGEGLFFGVERGDLPEFAAPGLLQANVLGIPLEKQLEERVVVEPIVEVLRALDPQITVLQRPLHVQPEPVVRHLMHPRVLAHRVVGRKFDVTEVVEGVRDLGTREARLVGDVVGYEPIEPDHRRRVIGEEVGREDADLGPASRNRPTSGPRPELGVDRAVVALGRAHGVPPGPPPARHSATDLRLFNSASTRF
jgi:hypothetical protein